MLEHPLRVSFRWVSADVQNDECHLVWEDERLLGRHVEMNVEIRLEMRMQFAEAA